MRKGTKISRSFQLISKETILHESRRYLLNMFFFAWEGQVSSVGSMVAIALYMSTQKV